MNKILAWTLAAAITAIIITGIIVSVAPFIAILLVVAACGKMAVGSLIRKFSDQGDIVEVNATPRA